MSPGRPAPAVVSIVSQPGAGKTAFLERLVPELASRGLEVGVLKHHAHPTSFDVPGKDTWRLSQAGARVVVGASGVQVAVFRREDGTADPDAVIGRHLADMDIVLTEGLSGGPYPKIEVHRAALGKGLRSPPGGLIALVTDEPLGLGVPEFRPDDPAGVADLLLARLPGREPRVAPPHQSRDQ